MITNIIYIIVAYFLGNIMGGKLLEKIYKEEFTNKGSGNVGARNAGRVLGARSFIFVLVVDFFKGFLVVIMLKILNASDWVIYSAIILVILGHIKPVIFRFKGGKGVATSLGVFLFLIPVITLILLVIFILVAYFTRYISLASITAAFLLPIFTFFTHRDSYLFALSVIIAIFVIYRHKTNISRLLSGTENKFKF